MSKDKKACVESKECMLGEVDELTNHVRCYKCNVNEGYFGTGVKRTAFFEFNSRDR